MELHLSKRKFTKASFRLTKLLKFKLMFIPNKLLDSKLMFVLIMLSTWIHAHNLISIEFLLYEFQLHELFANKFR